MQSKMPTSSNPSTSSVDDLLVLLSKQMAKQLEQENYPWLFANLTLCTKVLRSESLTLSLPWLINDFLPFLSRCCLMLDDCVREFDFRIRLHKLVRNLSDSLQKSFTNDTNAKAEIDKLLDPLLTGKLTNHEHGTVDLPHFYEHIEWTSFESFFHTHDESERFCTLKKRHGQRIQSLSSQMERNRYRYLSEPIISYWKTLSNQDSEVFKAMDKQPLIALGEGLWGAIISDPEKYKNCWQPLLVLQDLLSNVMSIAAITALTTPTSTPTTTAVINQNSVNVPSAFAGALILHQLAKPFGTNTSITEIEICLKKAVTLNNELETVLARAEDCALFRFDEAKQRLHRSRQGFVCQNPISYESLYQVFTVQQKHTQDVMELLDQFVQAAQTALGSNVVDIAFCVLGSTSRQDRRPYSDLEFLVLYTPHQGISREQAEFYVFQCISLVEMQIIALGETYHHQKNNAGLHVDSSHHVFAKDKDLWGTPKAIVDKFILRASEVYRHLSIWSSNDTKKPEIAQDELLVKIEKNCLVLDQLGSYKNLKLTEEDSKAIIPHLPSIGKKSQDTDLINLIVSHAHFSADNQHPWVADRTFYALLQPVLINTNDSAGQKIFSTYQELVHTFLEEPVSAADQPVLLKKTIGLNPQRLTRRQAIALACCCDIAKESAVQLSKLKNGATVNIKEVYYKPLAYFAMNLKLFYGLKTLHPVESFRAVAQQHDWAGDLIERLWCDALAFMAQQQVNLHLTAGHQEEEIKYFTFTSIPTQTTANTSAVTTTSTSLFQASSDQILASGLDLIANGLILPLAQELPKAIQADSCISLREIAYPILRAYLAAREKWFARWQKIEVSEKILLEHPLIRSLETTPAFDGWSPYYERHRMEQMNAFEQFVTPTISCCQVEGLPTRKGEKVYLPENYAKTWFDDKGNFLETHNYSSKNSQVRRVECDKAVFYFKVKIGNEKTLMGREFAVQALHGLLGGESQLSWGWPLKLIYSRREMQKIYYAWVSTEVLGESLDTVMKNASERLKANAIEPESYSQHLLLAYLTCPEDGQPANFKLQRITQATSRLIGIDVGQSFVNTTKQEKKSQPVINVKTTVYCLDQVALPLAESVITWCKLVNVDTWFVRWQNELNQINRLFKPFLEKTLVDLSETAQQCVRQRFQLLQRYLITLSQPPTGWQLLERLDPLVALSYQSLQGKIKTPEHFSSIDPKAYVKDPTTGRIYSITTFQQIQEQTLNPGQLQKTLQLQPDYFDVVDFNAMKKHRKADGDQQRFALELLKETAKKAGNRFYCLNLSGCQVIEEKELIALLEQMPNLKELNLENCLSINLETIFNLFSHRYNFSGLFWLNYTVLCEQLEGINFTHEDKPTRLVVTLNPEGRRGLIERMKSYQTQKTKVINALLKALGDVGDADSDVRYEEAKALKVLKTATPRVVEVFDVYWDMRQAAAKALGNLEPTLQLIEALLKALGNADWCVRQAAAIALRKLKTATPQIIEALIKALGDADWFVRRVAVEALGNLKAETPSVTEALLKALGDADSKVCYVAAEALCKLKTATPQAIEVLLKGLGDSSWYERAEAAEVLGKLKIATSQIIEVLLKDLSDADSDVERYMAAESLGNLQTATPQVIDALVKTLSDSNRHLCAIAAEAMGKLKTTATPPVMEALIKALGDADWPVRRAAAEALGNLKAASFQALDEVLDALVKALDSRTNADLYMRRAVVNALGNLVINAPMGNLNVTTLQVIEALLKEALGNAYWHVRQAATNALGNLKAATSQLLDVFVKTLGSADLHMRRAAAEALGKLKTTTPQIIEALFKDLGDADSDGRYVAAIALGNAQTPTPQVIEILLKALSDVDSDGRRAAASTLGNVQTATSQIIERLLKALGDSHLDVREAAAEALGKIYSNHYELNFLRSGLTDVSLNLTYQNPSKYKNTLTKEIWQKKILFFTSDDGKSFRAIPCVCKDWQRWHEALVEKQHQKLLGEIPYHEGNAEEEVLQEDTNSEQFQFTSKIAPQ